MRIHLGNSNAGGKLPFSETLVKRLLIRLCPAFDKVIPEAECDRTKMRQHEVCF